MRTIFTQEHLYRSFKDLSIGNTEWTFEVVEHMMGADTLFVAFSHVWSDGLGNTAGNEIPRCHIPFLQRALWISRAPVKTGQIDPRHLDEFGGCLPNAESIMVYGEESKIPQLLDEPIMPFWLDTFCVPRCNEVTRTNALRLTGKTYASASAVLVLDQEFCGMAIGGHGPIREFHSLTNIEAVARIISSKWMRRLWTLQEGLLAKKLIFLFAEGAVDIKGLIAGVQKYAETSEPGHVIARQLARGLEAMIDFKEADLYGRLIRVWNASVGRTASRAGDVPVCMASSIGLDPGMLHSTHPEDRAVMFYAMLNEIPQNIIFSGAKKLSEPGFRWADKYLAREYLDVNSARGRVKYDPWCLEVTFHTYLADLDLRNGKQRLVTDLGHELFLRLDSVVKGQDFAGTKPHLILLSCPDINAIGHMTDPPKAVIFTQVVSDGAKTNIGRIMGFGKVEVAEVIKADETDATTTLSHHGLATWRLT